MRASDACESCLGLGDTCDRRRGPAASRLPAQSTPRRAKAQQRRYLRRLARHVDVEVLASEEMWR